jgi:hypothetical protein
VLGELPKLRLLRVGDGFRLWRQKLLDINPARTTRDFRNHVRSATLQLLNSARIGSVITLGPVDDETAHLNPLISTRVGSGIRLRLAAVFVFCGVLATGAITVESGNHQAGSISVSVGYKPQQRAFVSARIPSSSTRFGHLSRNKLYFVLGHSSSFDT